MVHSLISYQPFIPYIKEVCHSCPLLNNEIIDFLQALKEAKRVTLILKLNKLTPFYKNITIGNLKIVYSLVLTFQALITFYDSEFFTHHSAACNSF